MIAVRGGHGAAGPPQGDRLLGGAARMEPPGRPKATAPWGERRAAPFGGA